MFKSRANCQPFLSGCLVLCACLVLSACQPAAPAAAEPESVGENASLENPTPVAFTPTPQATATPAGCRETRGKIENHEIHSDLLTYPVNFRVYLPPCYDPQVQPGYPVLYLLHGQSFNEDQWDRLGADEIADEMITAGEAPPFIIVMPREPYYLQEPSESTFETLVMDVLIPWVDQNYATCPSHLCRAIGGLSRGSGWAMRLALTHYHIFSSVAAVSFAPLKGDQISLIYWLREIPEDFRPRVYMDAGDLDTMLKPAREFEEIINYQRFPHEWRIVSGMHNEDTWKQHMEDYLRWFAEGWQTLKQ
jgi:enterochelin esterase-like enzyme